MGCHGYTIYFKTGSLVQQSITIQARSDSLLAVPPSQAAAVPPDCGEGIRRAARWAAVRASGLPLLPRLHQPAARPGQNPTAVHPTGGTTVWDECLDFTAEGGEEEVEEIMWILHKWYQAWDSHASLTSRPLPPICKLALICLVSHILKSNCSNLPCIDFLPPNGLGASVSCFSPQISEAVLASGEHLSRKFRVQNQSPLMYEWYQEQYVGAAHGLAGIYYFLMQVKPAASGNYTQKCPSHFCQNPRINKYLPCSAWEDTKTKNSLITENLVCKLINSNWLRN